MFLVVLSHFKDSRIVHTPILLEENSEKEKGAMKQRMESVIRRHMHGTANLKKSGAGIGVYAISETMPSFKLPPRSNRIYFLHPALVGWTEEWKTKGENHHHTVKRLPQLMIPI